MTALELAEMLERCDREMTQGPWGVYQDTPFGPIEVNSPSRDIAALDTWDHRPDEREADANGIAALRNAAPAIARCLREMAQQCIDINGWRQTAHEYEGAHEHLDICGVPHEESLIRRVDALANERDAAIREADRLRHGVAVEGDFVCPDSMEVQRLTAERDAATRERDEARDANVYFKRYLTACQERDRLTTELAKARASASTL